jgi:hypothetical protein
MPTLLSVNNYYYYRGGAETVFLEHNRLFEGLGWKVVPFAMHGPRNLQTALGRLLRGRNRIWGFVHLCREASTDSSCHLLVSGEKKSRPVTRENLP